jgi:arginine-tRNA-protein transferase
VVPPAASLLTPLECCEYLPDRDSQLRYDLLPELTPDEYAQRLRDGWRRFGYAVFRPECPSCRMCQSLRVPAATFRPGESQRRAWKKNAGVVSVRVGEPSLSDEKLALWETFHRHGFETKGWPPAEERDIRLLLLNPFPTEEWCYYIGDRLVGVGYVDALREGLSAIYFYYDPDESHRSLGTFNVLSLLDAARTRGVPHVYLGYYVAGCRSLEYKARFRPHEILRPDGRWVPSA